jgi:Glycosyl transferase family 2
MVSGWGEHSTVPAAAAETPTESTPTTAAPPESKSVVGICSYVGYEGLLLLEWLEYHRLLGVTNYYLYIDVRDQDTRQMLRNAYGEVVHELAADHSAPLPQQPAEQQQSVTLSSQLDPEVAREMRAARVKQRREERKRAQAERKQRQNTPHRLRINIMPQREHVVGQNPQAKAFDLCVQEYATANDWLLFIDVDEFVGLQRPANRTQPKRSLATVLDSFGMEVTGVLLVEKMFTAAGGHERSDRPTRAPGSLLTATLRWWRSAPVLMLKMALHTGYRKGLHHCRFNPAENPARYAHNCLSTVRASLRPVLAHTGSQGHAAANLYYQRLNTEQLYGPLFINHYYTRTCYEWRNQLIPKRASHLWYQVHEEGGGGQEAVHDIARQRVALTTETLAAVPQWMRNRMDPEFCTRFATNATDPRRPILPDTSMSPYLDVLHEAVHRLSVRSVSVQY